MAKTRTYAGAVAVAAAVVACGGGEILAIVQFVGSVGGDWRFDDPAQAGFQQRANCGSGTENCFVNIQPIGTQDVFKTDFGVRYTGNLPGCPPVTERTDGRIDGRRITLPGCFSGQYVNINEALHDNGVDRAYFDSAVPQLAAGVWIEIQQGARRFKFAGNSSGCELTTPTRTPVTVVIEPADIDGGRLQTLISSFTVGGQVWAGTFTGMSGMRLVRGTEVMELERRNLPDVC